MNNSLRREYLVSYDVELNKPRTAVYKELCKFGLKSVQKSVFWGYLTPAEVESIKRFLISKLSDSDKVFITSTNFNGRGASFHCGHNQDEFKDWNESIAI